MTKTKDIEWNTNLAKLTTGSINNELGFFLIVGSSDVTVVVKLKGWTGDNAKTVPTMIGAKRVAKRILETHIGNMRVQLRKLTDTI